MKSNFLSPSIFIGPGEYSIINGTIENNSDDELTLCQFPVYLESALIDKQVLRLIPAAGRYPFTVSIKINNEEQTAQLQVINFLLIESLFKQN